jgi:hypothetical protein
MLGILRFFRAETGAIASKTREEVLREELDGELKSAQYEAEDARTRYSVLLGGMYWVAIISGSAATALPIIGIPGDYHWLISLFAALATGLTVLRHNNNLRFQLLANEHAIYASECAGFRTRLAFEMPDPITRDAIASVSRDFRGVQRNYVERVAALKKTPTLETKPHSAA